MDSRRSKQLGKFLDYVLGRQPDEFGLLPDQDGFVKTKTLLKALSLEKEWRWVRPSHLNELVLTARGKMPIEIRENQIRALQIRYEKQPRIDVIPPKLLYTGIRKRAHAAVMQNGIRPLGGREWILLSVEPDKARRLINPFDPHVVLLTINVSQAQSLEVHFKLFGKWLWLTRRIPPGCFSGPPLAVDKQSPEKTRSDKPKARSATPGSFPLSPQAPKGKSADEATSQRKNKNWKRERLKARRQKESGWK